MKEAELWNYFWERKVQVSKPLDRFFIWVKPEDFKTVKSSFRAEYNLFHPHNSYRSLSYFKHIHAVDEGELICIHTDYGNWTKFWPLILIHFFIDVLPYLIYFPLKGINVKDLTKPN